MAVLKNNSDLFTVLVNVFCWYGTFLGVCKPIMVFISGVNHKQIVFNIFII